MPSDFRSNRGVRCVQWASLVDLRRDLGVGEEAVQAAVSYGFTEGWMSVRQARQGPDICVTCRGERRVLVSI
jgi:DNA-binding transcriptional regulator PaaX